MPRKQPYSTYTQQDFRACVERYQDQYRPGDPGYGEVEDFVWSYQPAFPLDLLEGGREAWAAWWRGELRDLEQDGALDRYDGLATWWLLSDAFEPLVLVEGSGGGPYFPWDGTHRIGISCCAGEMTAPSIVGQRRGKGAVDHAA